MLINLNFFLSENIFQKPDSHVVQIGPAVVQKLFKATVEEEHVIEEGIINPFGKVRQLFPGELFMSDFLVDHPLQKSVGGISKDHVLVELGLALYIMLDGGSPLAVDP